VRREIKTSTSHISVDDDGLVRAVLLPGADETLETARANMAAVREVVPNGSRSRFLIDYRAARSMSREARTYYAGPETAEVQTGVAILVESPLSRALGNFFIGFNKPLVPLRLFSSEEEALSWLRTLP